MKNLEKNSINIYPGIIVHWPQSDKNEPLDMTETALKFHGCFAANNSTVTFVNDQGEVFVTPYTRQVIMTLDNAGYKNCHSNFYVPFSNGDYPIKEKNQWLLLRKKAQQSYGSDFISDCTNWCDEHHIRGISKESLQGCFKMPNMGVPIENRSIESRYFPVCNQTCCDSVVVTKLGKYCTNNGKCVFVYRDGSTYVSRGYWILDELRAAGFCESGIFVPFSNGEEITDLKLKAQWENIRKK